LGGGVRCGRVHTVVDVQGLVGRRKRSTVDGVGEKMPLSCIDIDGGRDINTVKGAGECTGVGTGGAVEESDTGPDPGNIEDGTPDGLISHGIKPPGKRDSVTGTGQGGEIGIGHHVLLLGGIQRQISRTDIGGSI